MQEIDMSRPGSEMFPENYADANADHAVGDPLNTGVSNPDVAGQEQAQESPQQANFRALREEVSKMQAEREYWKGKAEAYSSAQSAQASQPQQSQDAYSALDWDDSRDVRRAFESIREENQRLRSEFKDAITAVETKSQRQDWNSMVTQHVPQLTSKNPIFAEMIQKASNPYEAAYLLAELNARASNTPLEQAPQQTSGQRAVNNAHKPQTLASVGGQGQLSAADYYASMSDEDFMKVANRNLAGI